MGLSRPLASTTQAPDSPGSRGLTSLSSGANSPFRYTHHVNNSQTLGHPVFMVNNDLVSPTASTAAINHSSVSLLHAQQGYQQQLFQTSPHQMDVLQHPESISLEETESADLTSDEKYRLTETTSDPTPTLEPVGTTCELRLNCLSNTKEDQRSSNIDDEYEQKHKESFTDHIVEEDKILNQFEQTSKEVSKYSHKTEDNEETNHKQGLKQKHVLQMDCLNMIPTSHIRELNLTTSSQKGKSDSLSGGHSNRRHATTRSKLGISSVTIASKASQSDSHNLVTKVGYFL
ncbi:unnamed protein product [Protopolystoma xenopodis]|uniref:Uncharacterized protein n=1 Tax=Protopolystoma xenopodis TaxID=117903 RepID=A0A3S5A3I6_9PLAT|nr:unnamed protein product [Protopolystoma xenopodis]